MRRTEGASPDLSGCIAQVKGTERGDAGALRWPFFESGKNHETYRNSWRWNHWGHNRI